MNFLNRFSRLLTRLRTARENRRNRREREQLWQEVQQLRLPCPQITEGITGGEHLTYPRGMHLWTHHVLTQPDATLLEAVCHARSALMAPLSLTPPPAVLWCCGGQEEDAGEITLKRAALRLEDRRTIEVPVVRVDEGVLQ